MKLIIAIIQPEELPAVKEELLKRNIYKFTITMQGDKVRKYRYKRSIEVYPMKLLC